MLKWPFEVWEFVPILKLLQSFYRLENKNTEQYYNLIRHYPTMRGILAHHEGYLFPILSYTGSYVRLLFQIELINFPD